MKVSVISYTKLLEKYNELGVCENRYGTSYYKEKTMKKRIILSSVVILIWCMISFGTSQEFWTPLPSPKGAMVQPMSGLMTDPLGNAYIVYGYRTADYGHTFRLKCNASSFDLFNFYKPIDRDNSYPVSLGFKYRQNGELYQFTSDLTSGGTIDRFEADTKEWTRIYDADLLRTAVLDDKGGIFAIYYESTINEVFGIAVSHDRGDTWDYNSIENDVGTFTEFLMDSNYWFYTLHDFVIYCSKDYCKTWQPIPTDELKFKRIRLCPDRTVIAHTDQNRIFKKSPESSAWKDITVTFPESYQISDFIVSAKGTIYLFVYNRSELKFICKSTDKGDTWKTEPFTYEVSTMLPENSINYKFEVTSNDHIILWGNQFIFLRSKDDGATWEQISDGLKPFHIQGVNADKRVQQFFSTTSFTHLFSSINNGKSFNYLGNPNNYGNITLAGSVGGNKTYLALKEKIYCNTNTEWETCSSIDTGVTPKSVDIIELALNNQDHVYAATKAKSVFISKDGAKTWNNIYQGSKKSAPIAAMAVSSDNTCVLVLDTKRDILRLNKQSQKWDTITSNLPDLTFKQIESTTDNYLIMLSNEGTLFRATSTGGAWSKIDDGIKDTTITSFAINRNNSIFATNGRVIFWSDDRGSFWVRMGESLRENRFHSLCANSDGHLFAVDSKTGEIIRSVKMTGSIFPPMRNATMSNQVIATPLSQQMIKLHLTRKGHDRITILAYSPCGKKVGAICNNKPISNTSNILWNTEGLARGLYILHLSGTYGQSSHKILLTDQ